jgi:hypothetical protein
LTYAKDVVEAYKECNCKIVEVSLGIVQKPITNAGRIRAMSDEDLAKYFTRFYLGISEINGVPVTMDDSFESEFCKWLKQPAEEVSNDTT